MTWKQLELLINGWTVKSDKNQPADRPFESLSDFSNDDDENHPTPKSFARRGPTVDELRIFNITAGIERIPRKKAPPPPRTE